MELHIHATSSLAGIAGTCLAHQPQKPFDFRTRCCGLSLPTLFKRMGIVAADGQPLLTRFHAAHPECARRTELALRAGSSSRGPEARAGWPVNTPATRIASGPADGQAAAIRMRVDRECAGPTAPAKTTPTAIASGPAHAPSEARLDNRIGMALAKPSSRPSPIHFLWRRSMARAGPFT